jgi:hypothetical protein
MTTTQTKIVNTSTGEEIVRDMTAAELAQLESDQENAELLKSMEITKATEKAALLAKLGITDDEAKLLLS